MSAAAKPPDANAAAPPTYKLAPTTRAPYDHRLGIRHIAVAVTALLTALLLLRVLLFLSQLAAVTIFQHRRRDTPTNADDADAMPPRNNNNKRKGRGKVNPLAGSHQRRNSNFIPLAETTRNPISFVAKAWIGERDDDNQGGRTAGGRRPKMLSSMQPGFSYDIDRETRQVCFTSTAYETDPTGQPITVSWDFGDGNGAQDQPTVCHTYTQYGTYTVTQTVLNSKDEMVELTRTVAVVEPTPDPPDDPPDDPPEPDPLDESDPWEDWYRELLKRINDDRTNNGCNELTYSPAAGAWAGTQAANRYGQIVSWLQDPVNLPAGDERTPNSETGKIDGPFSFNDFTRALNALGDDLIYYDDSVTDPKHLRLLALLQSVHGDVAPGSVRAVSGYTFVRDGIEPMTKAASIASIYTSWKSSEIHWGFLTDCQANSATHFGVGSYVRVDHDGDGNQDDTPVLTDRVWIAYVFEDRDPELDDEPMTEPDGPDPPNF